MISRLIRRAAVGTFAAMVLGTGALAASPYDAIYAFSDSWSAAGNSGPAPPYYLGQWSNGNIWLQTVASDFGLSPLTSSLSGGTDYGYGGASSGPTLFNPGSSTDVSGPGGQIAQFQAAHPTADPNALYTIEVGGADVLSIPSGATTAQGNQLLQQTVGNIDGAIAALAAEGAKNFLVMTVFDIGKVPAGIAAGPANSATVSGLTATLNSALVGGNSTLGIASLAQVAATNGVKITTFDTYAWLDQVVANGAQYGFSDVTDPCYDVTAAPPTTCGSPGQYLFWDTLHLSAAGHLLLGSDVAAALQPAPVPLPAALWLLTSGLCGIGLLARRRRDGTLPIRYHRDVVTRSMHEAITAGRRVPS